MTKILILLLRFYKIAISPFLGNVCRFTPSCSAYAEEAITKHGLFKGTWLAAKRLLRCGPWSQGGFDPVPETLKKQ
jgi:putative membrane protein insertion efficiency factor